MSSISIFPRNYETPANYITANNGQFTIGDQFTGIGERMEVGNAQGHLFSQTFTFKKGFQCAAVFLQFAIGFPYLCFSKLSGMQRYLKYFLKLVVLGTSAYLYFFVEPEFPEKFLEDAYKTSLALLIFLFLISLSLNLAEEIYHRRKKLPGFKKDSVFVGLRNIFAIVSFLAVFVSIFGFFGIDFVTLFTSLSIVAAAIAITTKEYIIDVLAGINLGFSRDFEIGDYIQINDQKGKILDIGLLRFKLLNDDDDVVFMPNSKVYASEITNYTRRDIGMMSIDFQIDILKIDGIERLESELVESISEYSDYIYPDSYYLKIKEVKKDFLDLKFQYRLRNMDQELHRNIRRRTVRKVLSYVTATRPFGPVPPAN